MTKILHQTKLRSFSPRKKGKRPLEPQVFARVEPGRTGQVWAMYVCIHKQGEFRRIEFDLQSAERFLTDCFVAVRNAMVVQ